MIKLLVSRHVNLYLGTLFVEDHGGGEAAVEYVASEYFAGVRASLLPLQPALPKSIVLVGVCLPQPSHLYRTREGTCSPLVCHEDRGSEGEPSHLPARHAEA